MPNSTATPGLRRVVSRDIPLNTQCMLWGRAAGRCEFRGCNKPLWKSSITREQVNIAQKAHIYAFGTYGPRPDPGQRDVHRLDNLLLVCHECHRKIDQHPDGGRYSVSVVEAMKREHEDRIERVTGITPTHQSHVLLYGANIGAHSSPLRYDQTAPALFPDHYPASDRPIELGMVNSSFQDRDEQFWAIEESHLRHTFKERVQERRAAGDVHHLSVFGLAPQPLLMVLGSLLGDITPADVYQRHREPASWAWPSLNGAPPFLVDRPACSPGPPALALALSATVRADRITAVLGKDARIWTVTAPAPHNDMLASRTQLGQLRQILRSLFDEIKAAYNSATTLHVFPAAPVSAVIEFGRVRMPKADMPWLIYDEQSQRGGFVPAITISHGGS